MATTTTATTTAQLRKVAEMWAYEAMVSAGQPLISDYRPEQIQTALMEALTRYAEATGQEIMDALREVNPAALRVYKEAFGDS